MFAKTTAVGRLTRDPETKNFGESAVTRFSIAVDEGFGDKKKTHFYNCSAWNKLGANVQQFTKKGSLVLVEGMMISSKKENVTYWELRADSVKFLSSNNEGGQQGGGQQQPQQGRQRQQRQPQQQYAQQPQYAQQQQFAQQPQFAQQQQYAQQQQFAPQGQYQDPFSGAMEISDDQLPF